MAGDGTPSGSAGQAGRRTVAGKGVFGGKVRRLRKVPRDNIRAITKNDIRRMARRGGVKRISAAIYDTIRDALKSHLAVILKDVTLFTEHGKRKTVTVSDVIFALKRIGRPIYGFDPDKHFHPEKPHKRTAD